MCSVFVPRCCSDLHLCGLQVAIVGIGGVGSVAAEMLTRCGVGRLLMYGERHAPQLPGPGSAGRLQRSLRSRWCKGGPHQQLLAGPAAHLLLAAYASRGSRAEPGPPARAHTGAPAPVLSLPGAVRGAGDALQLSKHGPRLGGPAAMQTTTLWSWPT